MLETAAVRELGDALSRLEAIVALRLEERGATSAGASGPPGARIAELLRRPIERPGGDGLPAPHAYAGSGPLAQLVAGYRLDAAEALTIVAALAPEVDEKFDLYYGHLSDRPEAVHLTGEVLRNLLGRSLGARLAVSDLLAPGAKLRQLDMVHLDGGPTGVLTGRLRLSPELGSWLLGCAGHEPEFSSEFPARRLRTVHRFDDLVVPVAVRARLREILDRIRHRATVLDRWGFAERHDNAAGFHVLFHGPPGTGKTMAAAVLAREAELPLYRIDLSSLVSKYIGETEKNLSRLFERAEAHDWILCFDEADALFGRRAEVHDARDRYANQEVSYLLQRLETFTGVTILATNLEQNLDDAFRRRLHAEVGFPEPGPEERRALWRAVLPEAVPLDEDAGLDELAERYTLTGAEIRNAAFHAAFLAAANGGRVRGEHLVAGVRAEYEKAGRMFAAAGDPA